MMYDKDTQTMNILSFYHDIVHLKRPLCSFDLI
jgi:hypothetical protein